MGNLEDDRSPVKKKVGMDGFSRYRTTETTPQATKEALKGYKRLPKVSPKNKRDASYDT